MLSLKYHTVLLPLLTCCSLRMASEVNTEHVIFLREYALAKIPILSVFMLFTLYACIPHTYNYRILPLAVLYLLSQV